jgi:hypothetical protein
MLFLLVVSLCIVWYGCSVSRRARENHARAETILRAARLTRVLGDAIGALSTVEQHQIRTLPTGDPRRMAIIHRMLDDLEERDVLAAAEVETALRALDVAAGRE